MGLILNYLEGETPLEEEALEGLLIKNIGTKRELNEFEQRNIEEALLHYKNKRGLFSLEDFLSEKFIKDLHYRMFRDVWSWAGQFRRLETNFGLAPENISLEIRKLLDDVRYWLDNDIFSVEEIALRLKHRVVFIHPFLNGNGRHSRLLADLFLEKVFAQAAFSWGQTDLYESGEARQVYLKALRQADQGDYRDLLIFAQF